MLWGWFGRVGLGTGRVDSPAGPAAGIRHFRTIGADAILYHEGITATADTDASLLREGFTATASLDADVNNHFNPLVDLDASLQNTLTVETGLGRLVQRLGFTTTAVMDGSVARSFNSQTTVDGWLQGTTAVQADISAVISPPPPGTQARSVFLHYKLLKTFSLSADFDAILNGPKTLTAGINAVPYHTGITRSTILGGALKNTLTKATGLHAIALRTWAATTQVDHRISKVFTATAGIGATVKNNLQVAASIDAELEATPVGGDNALDFSVLDNSMYVGAVV